MFHLFEIFCAVLDFFYCNNNAQHAHGNFSKEMMDCESSKKSIAYGIQITSNALSREKEINLSYRYYAFLLFQK